jgi:replicative DNA helicase
MVEKRIEIIAGRPSSGKTLLASQICREGVNKRRSILYFSLELTVDYIRKNFGIPNEVSIIDDPNLNWLTMKKIIQDYQPDDAIIDYLQLLNNFTEDHINHIIKSFQEKNIESNLYLLSQVSAFSEYDSKAITHKNLLHSNIDKTINNIVLTTLSKFTKQINIVDLS